MTDIIEFFKHIKTRTSMYIQPVKYDSVVALMTGYDLATDDFLLQGFHEWLVLKLGYRSNFYWGRLILMLAFPETSLEELHGDKLSIEDREIAIATLFNELEEFYLIKKDRNKGLRWIYAQYEEFVKNDT